MVPVVVVDLVILGMTLLIAYVLYAEGAWGAALMFFNVLFASLVAFNFYEPLATLMASNTPGAVAGFSDMVCFLGIFIVTALIFRLCTESIAPTMVRFPPALYHLAGVCFGLGGGAVTMAVVLLAFHMAPVHKKLFGSVEYDHKTPFGLGLEYEFLAFFQRISGYAFSRGGNETEDPFRQYGSAHVFDPRGKWLIDHQNARFGSDGEVPPPLESGGSSSEASSDAPTTTN